MGADLDVDRDLDLDLVRDLDSDRDLDRERELDGVWDGGLLLQDGEGEGGTQEGRGADDVAGERAHVAARGDPRARTCARGGHRDDGGLARWGAEEDRPEASRLGDPCAQEHPGPQVGAARVAGLLLRPLHVLPLPDGLPRQLRGSVVRGGRAAAAAGRRVPARRPVRDGDDRALDAHGLPWPHLERRPPRGHARLRARVLRMDLPLRDAPPLLRVDPPRGAAAAACASRPTRPSRSSA